MEVDSLVMMVSEHGTYHQDLGYGSFRFTNRTNHNLRFVVTVFDDTAYEELASDTLEAHTNKMFTDAMTHGIGMMRIEHVPVERVGIQATPCPTIMGGAWEFPKSEEDSFAQRYERAMKIVNP